MEALIADMVQEDPKKRPTMDEVVSRFSEIKKRLSIWKLRSRMARSNEIWPVTTWRTVGHWYRTIGYVISLKPLFRNPNDRSNFHLTIALLFRRHISLSFVEPHICCFNRYLVCSSWLDESLFVLLALCFCLGRKCNTYWYSNIPLIINITFTWNLK